MVLGEIRVFRTKLSFPQTKDDLVRVLAGLRGKTVPVQVWILGSAVSKLDAPKMRVLKLASNYDRGITEVFSGHCQFES